MHWVSMDVKFNADHPGTSQVGPDDLREHCMEWMDKACQQGPLFRPSWTSKYPGLIILQYLTEMYITETWHKSM